MFYMVCYDISDDGRRRDIQKTLEGYGKRVQFSVFDCDISDVQYRTLRDKLLSIIDKDGDSVRFYPLCNACSGKIEYRGAGSISEDDRFFMI
ncbi:CRISPR-associated protein Cas2 [hydrothermal vent metagenome]|uniref:CRISPR-associated protein Cas2 n=1 Tax=hydrothermal vent metagenome TaxID=652676 RepID=A0A3B1DE07_9ZZZZ